MYCHFRLTINDNNLAKLFLKQQIEDPGKGDIVSYITRPEVSEGGPAITNLIQGVAREEADRHRQIEVSMDLPL